MIFKLVLSFSLYVMIASPRMPFRSTWCAWPSLYLVVLCTGFVLPLVAAFRFLGLTLAFGRNFPRLWKMCEGSLIRCSCLLYCPWTPPWLSLLRTHWLRSSLPRCHVPSLGSYLDSRTQLSKSMEQVWKKSRHGHRPPLSCCSHVSASTFSSSPSSVSWVSRWFLDAIAQVLSTLHVGKNRTHGILSTLHVRKNRTHGSRWMYHGLYGLHESPDSSIHFYKNLLSLADHLWGRMIKNIMHRAI